MFIKMPTAKCRVVKRITDHGLIRCLNPASVAVFVNMPGLDVMALCPDCARELAKEIIDTVPGGTHHVSRGRK